MVSVWNDDEANITTSEMRRKGSRPEDMYEAAWSLSAIWLDRSCWGGWRSKRWNVEEEGTGHSLGSIERSSNTTAAARILSFQPDRTCASCPLPRSCLLVEWLYQAHLPSPSRLLQSHLPQPQPQPLQSHLSQPHLPSLQAARLHTASRDFPPPTVHGSSWSFPRVVFAI